jgi:hypothetical protein
LGHSGLLKQLRLAGFHLGDLLHTGSSPPLFELRTIDPAALAELNPANPDSLGWSIRPLPLPADCVLPAAVVRDSVALRAAQPPPMQQPTRAAAVSDRSFGSAGPRSLPAGRGDADRAVVEAASDAPMPSVTAASAAAPALAGGVADDARSAHPLGAAEAREDADGVTTALLVPLLSRAHAAGLIVSARAKAHNLEQLLALLGVIVPLREGSRASPSKAATYATVTSVASTEPRLPPGVLAGAGAVAQSQRLNGQQSRERLGELRRVLALHVAEAAALVARAEASLKRADRSPTSASARAPVSAPASAHSSGPAALEGASPLTLTAGVLRLAPPESGGAPVDRSVVAATQAVTAPARRRVLFESAPLPQRPLPQRPLPQRPLPQRLLQLAQLPPM